MKVKRLTVSRVLFVAPKIHVKILIPVRWLLEVEPWKLVRS